MKLSSAEFNAIRDLVRQVSGITLEEGKEYLAESRLMQLVEREHISLQELVVRLRAEPFAGLHREVAEAMTTNETSFFRDQIPFDVLRQQVLPELLAKRQSERKLNIWCGACSSGQEPYSIAMLLREHFPQLVNWRVGLIGSDFSHAMVARAKEGRYSKMEVSRGVPPALLEKYFRAAGAEWQINNDLRKGIEFRSLNLTDPWSGLPECDIIFLRNVLIYFSVPAKKAILTKIRQVLRPDGYLFLGAAETTINLDPNFTCVQFGKMTCYRRRAEALK